MDFGNELYLRFAGKSLVDILRRERGHVRLDPVASINMVRNVPCVHKYGVHAVNQVLLHSISLVVSLAVVFSVVKQRCPSLLRDYTIIRLSFDVNVMLNLYSFACHVRVWTGIS